MIQVQPSTEQAPDEYCYRDGGTGRCSLQQDSTCKERALKSGGARSLPKVSQPSKHLTLFSAQRSVQLGAD